MAFVNSQIIIDVNYGHTTTRFPSRENRGTLTSCQEHDILMCLQWWIKDPEGMSDLDFCELEDNMWDEFGESDDHKVPHPANEHLAIEGDCRKRQRHEVTGVPYDADTSTIYGVQGKEGKNLPTLTSKATMLEKGSWSHTSSGVFSSCELDSIKVMTSIASDDSRISSHCFKSTNVDSGASEFCDSNPVVGDGCIASDNNIYQYPLSQMPQTDDDLRFFDNDPEDRENGDLLYYGWPDIGNFEDVDRMFSTCDSTFELGNLNNDDDLSWFSPSHLTEGSEDAFKSDVKFSGSDAGSSKGILENQEILDPNSADTSTSGTIKKSICISSKTDTQSAHNDESDARDYTSFVNGLDRKPESRDWLIPKKQITLHKRKPKHRNRSEAKRTYKHHGNGGFFDQYDNLSQYSDLKYPHGDLTSQDCYDTSIQHKQSVKLETISYMQTDLPHMHLDYSHPRDQTSICPTLSGIKTEKSYRTLKEPSYASNQVLFMQSSRGTLNTLNEAPAATSGMRGKLYNKDVPPSLTQNFENEAIRNPMEYFGAVSDQKKMQQLENESESHSDVEGVSINVSAKLDSLIFQESSCMSSVADDISQEAHSFRQLQQVLDKLDIKTKLCIRDSLYRLARSAEQRHNCANQTGGIEDRDASGSIKDQEKNSGFMDMETHTNPIDRSIAHLLFHRPSDSSLAPANDSSIFRSRALMHESVASPHLMAEKQVCQDESIAAAEKKSLLDNR